MQLLKYKQKSMPASPDTNNVTVPSTTSSTTTFACTVATVRTKPPSTSVYANVPGDHVSTNSQSTSATTTSGEPVSTVLRLKAQLLPCPQLQSMEN